MSKFKLIQLLIILFWAFGTEDIFAQTITDTLSEVVITDSKIERPLRATSRPVEIITTETIQKYQGKGLDQLLEDQAGVAINGANSNPATIKNIYTRGAAPGYTLILIDGLPASDASIIGSTIDLRLLDINQVERIEIAKGSQSTLYGSDAIAGAINIITKKGGPSPFGLNLNASAGSFKSYDAGISVAGSTESFNYNLGFQYSESDGLSEAFDPANSGNFDNDGLEKQVISANVSYDITDKLTLAPSIQISSFEGGYDAGSFTDGSDTYESDLTNIGVRLAYDNDAFKINAAFNNVEADRSFFTQFGDFIFNGVTQNADVYATYKKGFISLIGGLHYQNASITDNSTTEIDPSWNIFSPYANFIYNKDRFQIEAGLRLNNHSDFGSNFNYAITPSLFLSNDVKIFASYATAFKAPALYELYGAFGANPELDPQTSSTFEFGSKYNFPQGSISATYFNRNVDNVILFTSRYENFAEQKDQGIELTSTVFIEDGFNIQLSYIYLEGGATDQTGMETENLYKRPGVQAGFHFDYTPSDKWNIRMMNHFYGKRTDIFFDFSTFSSSVVDMRSYFKSDLAILYKPSIKTTLFIHLNNIWDNDFFETYGFTTPGANGRIGGTLRL